MKINILWEDQRSTANEFGPHDLLCACVADHLNRSVHDIKRHVNSAPKKSNSKVLKALENDLGKLRDDGPVCAVIDHDKVLRLWHDANQPPSCLTGIREAIYQKSQSRDFELVLLKENVETLVEACCQAAKLPKPDGKDHNDRDRSLKRVAWSDRSTRDAVRQAVPSFDRVVKWVARQLA